MFSGISQNVWVNLIGFNLIWILSVLYKNEAVLVVSIFLLLHLLLHTDPITEAFILVIVTLLGYSLDSVMTLLGVYWFENNSANDLRIFAPLWLALLWLSFAATLRQSLSFFSNKIKLSGIAGGFSGGFSYFAAANLGAVSFPLGDFVTVLMVAVIWAFLFPLLLVLTSYIERALCTEY
ncbi:DUF2878 domain-containing protein [Neptuniibacter sp. 1_MG-2023]|uniref:DUF2878 domain-containing protein n=1 Tax=Neptuniibacter sp. 1_MG-2023 TaxID=3062662 RepID=UPI0026E43FD2|nr:DUF2878 domain-containing protein [Neptuniibacter sp. 1_MG-2023]MDO6595047.1 DUF2878 domain-containing protein [Neptuniibacter sp. 1_MG-2023]